MWEPTSVPGGVPRSPNFYVISKPAQSRGCGRGIPIGYGVEARSKTSS